MSLFDSPICYNTPVTGTERKRRNETCQGWHHRIRLHGDDSLGRLPGAREREGRRDRGRRSGEARR